MAITSIGVMVKRLDGLVGTKDISEWEDEFIRSVISKTKGGINTPLLSEKQIEVIERIHKKHFGA